MSNNTGHAPCVARIRHEHVMQAKRVLLLCMHQRGHIVHGRMLNVAFWHILRIVRPWATTDSGEIPACARLLQM